MCVCTEENQMYIKGNLTLWEAKEVSCSLAEEMGKVSSRNGESQRSLKVSRWTRSSKRRSWVTAEKCCSRKWRAGGSDGAAAFRGVSLWSTWAPWGEPCAAKSQISALSLRKKACRNPLWERRGSVSFQVRSPNDRGVRELGGTSKPCLCRRKRWEDMVSFSQTLGNL